MSDQQFNKWIMELANQEYAGRVQILKATIEKFDQFAAKFRSATATPHTQQTPDNVFAQLGIDQVFS